MPSQTVRLQASTHRALKELSGHTGESMSEVLTKAIEEYRRKLFLAGLSNDFAALRADPQAWREELAERRAWEATLSDDLGDDDLVDRADEVA